MNEVRKQQGPTPAAGLERPPGTGFLIEDLEIEGDGPVTIRLAVEMRLSGAVGQMVAPAWPIAGMSPCRAQAAVA
jgi:hypothetical protein